MTNLKTKRLGVDQGGGSGDNDPRITENPEGLPLWQGDDWPGGGADLSFEEQWTGRWDAREDLPRKIYVKSIALNNVSLPANSSYSIPHNIPDLHRSLAIYGYLYDPNRLLSIPLPRVYLSGPIDVITYGGMIQFTTGSSAYTLFTEGLITIEYTKEDD